VKDLLKIPSPGDPISASQQELIVRMLRAGFAGGGAFVDSTGVYVRARASDQDAVVWGKLDADLAYNNTTGVAFSIWELNGSNVWADTGNNVALVFPPFELAHALVPSGVKVEVTNRGGKWYVSQFPKVYEGTLAEDLTVAGGSADVTVGGDTFADCKSPNTLASTIPSGSAVTITLEADGYYHVTLAPC